MNDKYYLMGGTAGGTEQKAVEQKDEVEPVEGEKKKFHVPSYSEEDKIHTVELAAVGGKDLPPFTKPKCHHILAVEMKMDRNKYHNSYGDEEKANPDKYFREV